MAASKFEGTSKTARIAGVVPVAGALYLLFAMWSHVYASSFRLVRVPKPATARNATDSTASHISTSSLAKFPEIDPTQYRA